MWACLLDRRLAPPAAPRPRAPAARRPLGVPRLAAVIAVVSGFAVLSSEIAWFRYLSLFLGNRIYVTSVVLFIILYCLGFAARLSHKLLLKRSPLNVLSSACAVGIVSLAAGSAAQGPALRIVLETGSSWDFFNHAAALLFILGGIVIPAIAMGCLFPLALALSARDDQSTPGWLYGLNTLSAVLGSLFSSYFLMDRVGANGIMTLSALLLLLLLAGASIVSGETSSPARRLQAAAAGLAFLFGVAPGARAKLNLFSPEKTLLVREDAHGLFTIARADDGRLIVMNNNTALAFLFGDERTQFVQETQAYLPMLFSRNVDALLNIGIGYGITAGAMTLFPEVKTIDAVEILPAIVQSGKLFASRNYRYDADPRVTIRIADGRQFLAASARKYDVISVNVTDPYLPGSSSLYSDEFYGLAKDSLAPGGVLCQHIFGPDVVSLYHGIMRHFSYLKLIRAYDNGFTVIASDEPLRPRRLDSLKKVVAAHRGSVSSHFALRSAGQLLTLVEDGERWREGLESAKPALFDSDVHPELEFRRLSGLKSLLQSNN
jgi:spermidine synthase